MSNLRWSDDDELQVALGEALQEPPRSLVEAAKGSFALWNLDAELAALSHDSVEVQLADGGAAPLPVDEDGGFAVRPTPSCSFRLYWRAATGRKVVTDWTPL